MREAAHAFQRVEYRRGLLLYSEEAIFIRKSGKEKKKKKKKKRCARLCRSRVMSHRRCYGTTIRRALPKTSSLRSALSIRCLPLRHAHDARRYRGRCEQVRAWRGAAQVPPYAVGRVIMVEPRPTDTAPRMSSPMRLRKSHEGRPFIIYAH